MVKRFSLVTVQKNVRAFILSAFAEDFLRSNNQSLDPKFKVQWNYQTDTALCKFGQNFYKEFFEINFLFFPFSFSLLGKQAANSITR